MTRGRRWYTAIVAKILREARMHEDVTDAMEKFREQSQYLWNKYFRATDLTSLPESWACFDEIEKALFGAIVLSGVGCINLREFYREKPLEFLRVLYRNDEKNTILVGEKDYNPNRNIVWRELPFSAGPETQIWFIDYFQWDFYGKEWDFPFIRGYIAQHDEPLRGKKVLLERGKCRISFIHEKRIAPFT